MAKKVLLVEDDPKVMSELKVAAEEAGVSFLEAHNWQTAIAQATKEKPDAIVMDFPPPEEKPVTAFRELKNCAAPGAKMVLLMGTGKIELMTLMKFKKKGVADESVDVATHGDIIEIIKKLQ
jgi:DNA-binding response OmpR family regulator